MGEMPLHSLIAAQSAPLRQPSWAERKFITRARTLFFARLAFLAIALVGLAFPRLGHLLGLKNGSAVFIGYVCILFYSVVNYLVLERIRLGRIVTFLTLCCDLLMLVVVIFHSGGLRSPMLPTQLMYTIFFALLFPNPLAVVPPLLTLPVVVKMDPDQVWRALGMEGAFLLAWHSAVNFIVVYVIIYLNEREESQHRDVVELQEELKQMAVMEERSRLSREIHDGLGASLSSLIIQTEVLYHRAKDSALRKEILSLKESAEESIDELRRSISLLKSDFDLVPALEEYCCSFGQRTQLEVRFRAAGHIPKTPGKVELAVFRVLQEALQNVRKHSQARVAEVELVHVDGLLTLRVADQGVGFDYRGNLQGHYGLSNMRERARQHRGEFCLDSAPGKGCRIAFSVPVEESTLGKV